MLSKEDFLRRKEMWDQVLKSVRTFFLSRGFLEVDTPILVRSPGMEPNLDPFEVTVNSPNGDKIIAGLITSPEYAMKKIVAMGIEKIFTIAPTFRNFEEGKHNINEFKMLEWYATGDYQKLMNETEELFHYVLEDTNKWQRYSFKEAKVDKFGDPHVDNDRYFVTHYPVSQASLARISEDGEYAERFEAFADGMELCNGFSELIDGTEQRRRFKIEREERKKMQKTIFPIDEEFLEALQKIDKPFYGNALGLDRLVMLKNGVSSISEVKLFKF